MLIVSACSHDEKAAQTQPTPEKDDIVARVGETFEIHLPSNPTTGYRWIIAPAIDEKIVHLESQDYFRTDGTMPGAGGDEVWKFRAVGRGRTEIVMGYTRPWERRMYKAARFRVRVE